MANQYEAVGKSYEDAWPIGIKSMNDLAKQLVAKGDLPQDFTTTTRREQAPFVDLIQQTYEILTQLREPTPGEKKALEDRGQVFLPLESKTYAQVVAADQAHYWPDELNYANGKPALRDYSLPVAAEVGLNPGELVVPDSFSKSKQVQLEMAEERSQALQAEFPDARVIMLPSTGYAQADHAYKEKTGEVLLKNYFARALDQLSEAHSADAGRGGPAKGFNVCDWDAQHGTPNLGLVPAVVFVNFRQPSS